ncbi:MAG: hypothetical protein ACP5VF_10940 [Acidobacteriota bacterium]
MIWTDYSPPYGGRLDVSSWSSAVLPGANEDLYVVNGYADYWTVGDYVYHIDNQGQVSETGGAWFSRNNGTDDYSLFYSGISARNPADGQVYGLLAENFNYPKYNPPYINEDIVNLGTSSVVLTTQQLFSDSGCPPANGGYGTESFTIAAFGFDAQGDLLVVGYRLPCYHLVPVGIGTYAPVVDRSEAYDFWWFPASSLNGSTVVLSLDSALLPSPIEMGDFLSNAYGFFGPFGLAVSPSGNAICRVFWASGWAGGQSHDEVQDTVWAIPPMGSQEPVQQLPPPPPIPTDLQGYYGAFGTVAADCMGRFYLMGAIESGSNQSGPIVEYEQGSGGGWAENPWTAAAPAGGATCAASTLNWPAWLSSDAYGNLYESGWVPTPNGNYNEDLHRFSACELVDPHYYDNFTCCPTGVQYKDVVQKSRGENAELSCSTLTINISQNGQTIPVTQNGQTVTLPLGATPTLSLLSNNQPVSATWGLQKVCRTNGPDPDDLFPNNVVLLFLPNGGSGAGLAVMHVGSVQITATSTSGQSSLSITVKTVASGPLGSAHPELDSAIYTAAEQFGILPQYIKAMIQKESTFTATAYRYEPRTWDYGASQPGFRLRLGDPAFAAFAFQEPSMTGVPGSPIAEGPLTSSWKDMRLDARYSFKLLPSFAVWNQGQGCTAVTGADGDLSAYALSLGTSAWYAVVPAGSPYKYGPCGEGEDWYKPVSVWEYDEYRAGRCPSLSNAALDFFYDNPYTAQTVLAASYGYMQVGFEALKELGWLGMGIPANLEVAGNDLGLGSPGDLETAYTNIGLGSHWLARQRRYLSRYYGGIGQTSLLDLQDHFIWLCTLYNGSQKKSGTAYGTEIVRTLAPPFQPQIPAQ